jgi:hypothetical protein
MHDDDLSGSSLEFSNSNNAGFDPAMVCVLWICSKGCAGGCKDGCWTNASCKSCTIPCGTGCNTTQGSDACTVSGADYD